MAREEIPPQAHWILWAAMIGIILILIIVSYRFVRSSRRVRNLEDQLAALKLNPPATRGRTGDIEAVAKVFESASGLVVKQASDSAGADLFSEGLFGQRARRAYRPRGATPGECRGNCPELRKTPENHH